MKLRTAIISSAFAVALLVPAAADAHEVSSTQTVGAHVRAADRQLAKFEAAVKADADTQAVTALDRNRRQMRAASREARRVRRAAKGVRGANRAAKATALVGLQAEANAEVLAATVDEVSGRLQVDVAADLNTDLLSGASALGLLAALVDELPGSAQGSVVQAIGQLTQVQDVLTAITGALDPGTLTTAVEQSLTSSLAIAISTIDTGIETLNGLLGVAPAVALPLVQQALGIATAQLPGLVGSLQTLLGSGLAGLPSLGGGSGSIEVGVDGSLSSVSVTGLCGLVPALPFVALPGC